MTQWIIIPGWEKFQHYHDRRPLWIKTYLDQLDRDEYLELPQGARSLLHDVRLLYAARRGQLRLNTRWLSAQLNVRVTRQQLERLNQAGFIQFVASKPVAIPYQVDTVPRARARDREEEKDKEEPALATPNGAAPARKTNPRAFYAALKDTVRQLATLYPDDVLLDEINALTRRKSETLTDKERAELIEYANQVRETAA